MKYITLYQTLQLSQPPCKCRVKQSLKFETKLQNHEPIVCAIYLSLGVDHLIFDGGVAGFLGC